MEEKFFFIYNFKVPPQPIMQLPIHERRWLIERYVQQRQREEDQINAARKGGK